MSIIIFNLLLTHLSYILEKSLKFMSSVLYTHIHKLLRPFNVAYMCMCFRTIWDGITYQDLISEKNLKIFPFSAAIN